MIKPLLISILLVLSIYAKNSTDSLEYKNAINAYKNKDFYKAYELFDKLFFENLKNMNINYFLGKSAYNIGNYESALSAYERIVIYDPQNTRIWYEIAKTYYMQKNYKKSQEIFLDIQKKSPPKDVKIGIENYLSAIDKKIKKHIFGGTLIATLGYDSNINNRASEDKFTILGNIFTNTTKDVSEFYLQEVLLGNYTYRYKNNIHLKSNIVLLNKNINNEKDKDLQLISILPSAEMIYDKYSINYAILFDKVWSDSSSYLSSYGIKPSINYLYTSGIKLYASFKYIKKNYSESINKKRDSKYLEFLISSKYIYSDDILLKPSFSLEKESKSSGNLTNIDYTALNLALNVNYKYSNSISILPSIKYKNKKYSDTNSLYLKKQKDTQINLGLGALYIINKTLLANANLNYTDVKSNIDSSQYNKYTTTLSIIKSF